MRSVKRTEKPEILKEKADQWTQELLKAIEENGSYSKVSNTIKRRYNQPEIKQALKEMYDGCCCYCEGRVGDVSYGTIEHLKPESRFPEYAFEWENLHLCCGICNTTKKVKWDDNNPILDPTVDRIEDYLRINLISGEYEPINNNERAKTTIEHTDLNRSKLIEKRKGIVVAYCKYALQGKELQYIEDNIKLLGERTLYETIKNTQIK
ncbi:MAG: TIGR02646 family protein [Ruminococcus sp.]|nr:TIGR02646 family protein [Ruminococcus sp.]